MYGNTTPASTRSCIPYPLSVTAAAPATESLTVAEAKLQCKVEISDDDTLIGRLIATARETAERMTQRYLVTTAVTARFGDWPSSEFWLPGPKLIAVSAVKYYDTDGVQQTWNSSNYRTDIYSEPGRFSAKPSASYPSFDPDAYNPIQVEYTAGYGAAAAVPDGIKHGMCLLIDEWYEFRSDVTVGLMMNNLPAGAARLFAQYKVPWGYTHQ